MAVCFIVDDFAPLRTMACSVIEPLGFKIEEFEDGLHALERCKTKMPDFILLDWNMLLMDGMEFLHAIRKLPNGNYPKIIFCTVEIERNKIAEAMAAGADEYIMKPLHPSVLRGKMQQIGLIEYTEVRWPHV